MKSVEISLRDTDGHEVLQFKSESAPHFVMVESKHWSVVTRRYHFICKIAL